MWPRNVGADSFHVRRDASLRKVNAPFRVPINRVTACFEAADVPVLALRII
jgi:hypothetical protein